MGLTIKIGRGGKRYVHTIAEPPGRQETGCADLPSVSLVCGIATHPVGVLAPYPVLPCGVGSRLSGPGRVAIRSKRAPYPPQPAPPPRADTWFATRVPVRTVRGVWVRFGRGRIRWATEIVQNTKNERKNFSERAIACLIWLP